jgi:hypothetical protein
MLRCCRCCCCCWLLLLQHPGSSSCEIDVPLLSSVLPAPCPVQNRVDSKKDDSVRSRGDNPCNACYCAG